MCGASVLHYWRNYCACLFNPSNCIAPTKVAKENEDEEVHSVYNDAEPGGFKTNISSSEDIEEEVSQSEETLQLGLLGFGLMDEHKA